MASPDRPTGQVTFLFTDIEGSTKLVDALGTAAWSPLLARHREILRAAIVGHDGYEVATEGDSFFVVFRDAGAAVLAAADAQRGLQHEPWPDGAPIRVRMGLHTGVGELDIDDSYVGHDVHRAARVAAAAHGGQVLLSEVVSALVGIRLPDGLGLKPLGAHRLKDLRPERIAQLLVDGLPAEFPPIRSLDARPNNLPTELTSFIGREQELADVRELLDRSHLVTLTGPGGTGKSRLALQLAAASADQFPDGIWFVPLAAVSDAALVPSAMARATGVGEDPARRPVDTLAASLEGQRVLFVLDNLEQLPGAAGDVGELLRRLPLLRVVATSRSPLRVAGEQEFPVPGLPAPIDLARIGPYERERLPDAVRRRDPEGLLAFESVRLFVERARSVRPGFELTGANAADVASIVAHLDGVPLAIELAATRVRFLTPAAIHERLEGRLDLPGGGASDAPERQRSLRGAIAWSYELLEEPTRRLFERLSVFAGGFDLTCAAQVALDTAAPDGDILDGLASLVDQSLLRTSEAAGEPRFAYLEPIREYARERLEASGEGDGCRDRHARAFLALARGLEPELAGGTQRHALDRLELEHANLRAAIDRADARADAEVALGTVIAIWRFWQRRGYLREARARVGGLLARPWFDTAPAELRAHTHEVMGGIIYWHGDFTGAQADYEAALALWREIGDAHQIANALYNLSFCYSMGRHDDEEAVGIASALLDEALALYRSLGDDRGTANVLWGIGTAHFFRNQNEAAVGPFEEALELYRRVGDSTQEAWTRHQLGATRLKLGEVDAARSLVRSALRLFDGAGDVAGMTLALDDLSAVAMADGDLPRAGRLEGLARRLQASSGTELAGAAVEALESGTWPNAAASADPADLARSRAEGAAVQLPVGVRYALGDEEWVDQTS